LTIFYSNPRKKNRWRPGFYFGAVVHAPFKLKFKQRRYWKLFLSVKKVLKAFENFVNELKRQGIMF